MLFLHLLGALIAGTLILIANSSVGMLYVATFNFTFCIAAAIADIVLFNKRKFGSPLAIPIGAFFLIFFSQFNLVRSWVFVLFADDYLVARLGSPDPNFDMLRAICWSSIFVTAFVVSYGYFPAPKFLLRLGDKFVIYLATDPITITRNRSSVLLLSFVATAGCTVLVAVMSFVAGGTDLSNTISSAYVYMAPLVVYSICLAFYAAIFATSRDGKLFWIIALLGMFVLIAYFGRTLAQYRIYSITLPALIIGYHVSKKARPVILITGILIVFPLVTYLGQSRSASNQELGSTFVRNLSDDTSQGMRGFFLAPYMASGGDFTTIDIFASALKQEPKFYPYGMSWAYSLVHFVPRQWWASKPERGILYDTSYAEAYVGGNMQSLPYTPGVVGDAYLEGGYPFIVLIGFFFGMNFKLLDLILGRRKLLFGPTIDYCAIYSIFLFVAFFSNRSLPYFIVLYVAINVIGVFIGRYIIKFAVGFQQSSSGMPRRKAPGIVKPVFSERKIRDVPAN